MVSSPSTDAFTFGNACSARTIVSAMNAVNVSFTPERSKSSLSASRRLKTLYMSHSCHDWTCAEVFRLRTMCSAIFLRMIAHLLANLTLAGREDDSRRRSSLLRRGSHRWRPARGRCRARFRRRRSGAGCDSSAGSAGCSTYARMSFFVTRPPIPVPSSREMSTPRSPAILRTTGEDFVFRRYAASSSRVRSGASGCGAGTTGVSGRPPAGLPRAGEGLGAGASATAAAGRSSGQASPDPRRRCARPPC